MRSCLAFLFILLFPFLAAAADISDEGAARAYCDAAPLLRIEGIWEFPSDGTRVLIRRTGPDTKGCDIILLSSPDCRLLPGETIGALTPAAEAGRFRLSLCRRRSQGILSDPAHCAAKLSSSGNSLTINPRKLKLRLGTLWFLPRFWRALRLSVSDPEGQLTDGLVRLYPRIPDRTSDPVYL